MNSFLEFLCWHSIESTAFALGLLGLLVAFRLRRASSRFSILNIALLKFLIPVGALASLFVDLGDIAALTLKEYQIGRISALAETIEQSGSVDWFAFGSLIWLTGTIALAATRAVGLYRNHALVSQSHPCSVPTRERIEAAIDLAGHPSARRPAISETPRIASIGLIGFFRLRILINAGFLETLSDQELLSAIRHELAHARRFDNLWRLSHEFVVCLFWFHPLVWFLRGKLRAESELACDELALSQGEEPQSYARCLLKAASLNGQYTNPWVTTFSATSLKNRIRKIITFENKKESKMKLLLTHLSLLCTLSLSTLSSSGLYAEPAAPADTVFSLVDVDKKPSATVMVAPMYPESMQETKTAGSAVVSFVLDGEGKVHQAQAIKSTHRDFEVPAINAVLQSSWNPAEKDGKRVSVLVRIPITFQP